MASQECSEGNPLEDKPLDNWLEVAGSWPEAGVGSQLEVVHNQSDNLLEAVHILPEAVDNRL